MYRGLLRPGQGFKPFTVLRRSGGTTTRGRPIAGGLEPVGRIIGIISQASQSETEQHKQNGHPISHTIVQRGNIDRAKPTDVLELEDGRRFYVQDVHDPGELGHFTVYGVEERTDL